MTCQNCLYWLQAGPNLGGQCKRFPPAAATLPGWQIGMPIWPITASTEWCGEYLARGAVAPGTEESMQGAAETLGMEPSVDAS